MVERDEQRRTDVLLADLKDRMRYVFAKCEHAARTSCDVLETLDAVVGQLEATIGARAPGPRAAAVADTCQRDLRRLRRGLATLWTVQQYQDLVGQVALRAMRLIDEHGVAECGANPAPDPTAAEGPPVSDGRRNASEPIDVEAVIRELGI